MHRNLNVWLNVYTKIEENLKDWKFEDLGVNQDLGVGSTFTTSLID